ncbi:MAG: dicarboxylate/amino acid:cation symporter [Thermoprotei archaeon]|nr:dicarboxylate/amino acid:cation symporter [Thermoprotei archaeon]
MTFPEARRAYYIVAAMIIALVLGSLIGYVGGKQVQDLRILGDIFLRILRTIIPLLIFFTVGYATASFADLRRLGRLLILVLIIFIVTSALAASWGVLAGLIFRPGEGVGLKPPAEYTPPKPATWRDLVLSFFSLDFAELLSVGGALKLIVFTLIFGLAVALLGDAGAPIRSFLEAGSKVFIKIVSLIMYYAPIAVFGYSAWLIGVYGPEIVKGYVKLVAASYTFTLFHFIVIYGLIVWLGGLNPLRYYREQLEPFLVAFTTRSSAATLPVNMRAAERMGIPRDVYNMTLPIGATVNMDGTALYQALSAVFVAQLFGIALGLDKLLLLVLAAILGSIATAAIPGGGLIMLAFVLSTVGLPLEGIAIILAVDPILDAIRTAINVSGDNASSTLVTRIIYGRLSSPS